jgi:hypothetical protein
MRATAAAITTIAGLLSFAALWRLFFARISDP